MEIAYTAIAHASGGGRDGHVRSEDDRLDFDTRPPKEMGGSGEGTKFELPFIVQGTWDNAFVMPDAQSLIRRSGAAQPLLDAVRSRGGDAAVRSVIEQISKPSPLLPTGAKTAN